MTRKLEGARMVAISRPAAVAAAAAAVAAAEWVAAVAQHDLANKRRTT
jgi:hypothetical protein